MPVTWRGVRRRDRIQVPPIDPGVVSGLLQNGLLLAADAQRRESADFQPRSYNFLGAAFDSKLARSVEVERDRMLSSIV